MSVGFETKYVAPRFGCVSFLRLKNIFVFNLPPIDDFVGEVKSSVGAEEEEEADEPMIDGLLLFWRIS